MSYPNPFAPQVPAATEPAAVQPAAPAVTVQNPYAAPAVPQAYAPPSANPYAAPVAPQQAPQGPYGAPQQQVQQWAGVAPQQAPQAHSAPALGQVAQAPAPVAGDGRGAKLPDMYGRLVVAFPLGVETVARNPKFITDQQRQSGNVNQERMTVTFVVLDDGSNGMSPIRFGGAPHNVPPTPHTEHADLPYIRKGMWVSQSRLIGQLKEFLPGGRFAPNGSTPGMCAGRVVKTGPEANAPWFLTTATPDEVARANQYVQAVMSGQLPHPLA